MNNYYKHKLMQSLTLGKPTLYREYYDPSLLQAVSRAFSRDSLGLSMSALPFHGADIWTLYELSWLNANGLPQVAIAEVILDASTINLIESKSFKLYLNSFNQTPFLSWNAVRDTLLEDLSCCADGNVQVMLRPLSNFTRTSVLDFDGECIDDQSIRIEDYTFTNTWLKGAIGTQIVSETLVSHLFKSNCLITSQPDWGSVQIRYHGSCINREALLRYLVSFRQRNEFNEQCV